MAFNRMSFTLTEAHRVIGMNEDAGKEVWEYEGGNRTDRRKKDALGRDLFRFDALISGLSESGVVPITLFLTTGEPLGQMTEVPMAAGASGIVRPDSAFELVASVTGVRAEKTKGSGA
ncbi:hypothetical protein [Agrococcus casei]|uniref:hypothetical protein n=1 Tax=Agrococcus casei TaxID=343512 RepID=UPI003F8E98FB